MAAITKEQALAARAARGWTLRDLEAAMRARFGDAAVTFASINRFERGASESRGDTLRKLQAVYESEGLTFLNTGRPGVQWDDGAPAKWRGTDKKAAAKPKRGKSPGTNRKGGSR